GGATTTVNAPPRAVGLTTLNVVAGSGSSNTLDVTSSVATVNIATAGTITFGAGQPTLNYTNFQTVTVTKPATPPVGAGVAIAATTGQPLNNVVVATFTETDLGNNVGDFTASIDWGDNTPASSGTIQSNGPNAYNILGSHTYTAAGNHTVNVTLTDLG